MDVLLEIELFENRQVLVPELYRCVEDKPRLLSLLAELNSLHDMLGELHFLLHEGLLLLVRELPVVLILHQCYQLFVPNFYVF